MIAANDEDIWKKYGSDILSIIEKNMSDMICIHDPDGKYKYVSPSAETVIGFKPEELVNTSPYRFFYPEDLSSIAQYHQLILCGLAKDRPSIEYRHLKKDGSHTWLQTATTLIYGSDETVALLVTFSHDISRRKKAEQELHESLSKYSQLFWGSPVVWLLVDPEKEEIVAANDSALSFYGYAAEEMRRIKITDIDVALPENLKQVMLGMLGGDKGMSYLRTNKTRAGELREVEVYACPFRVAERDLVSAIIIDVTDRRKIQQQLMESHERISLVVEGSKAGIWDWDLVGNKVYLDKHWKLTVGCEDLDIGNRVDVWRGFWHRDDAAAVELAMQEYLQGKADKYEIEYRLMRKDGTIRWVHSTGKVTLGRSGLPVRMVGSDVDITDRKRNEELYQESERKLREFAQAMPNASFIIDEDGRYIEQFGNEKFFSANGITLKGKLISEVFDAKEAAFLLNEVRKTIKTGASRYSLRELTFGSEKRLIERRTAPMSYLVNGKKTAAVISVDITEQRRTERMLQLSYDLRRKSNFINDLVRSEKQPEEEEYIAKTLGFDINGRFFVILITSSMFEVGEMVKPHAIRQLKDYLVDLIGVVGKRLDLLAWDSPDGIGILCTDKTADWAKCKEYALSLTAQLGKVRPGLIFHTGVSETLTGGAGLRKAYRQCRSAALAARCDNPDRSCAIHYHDAGIFQFLPETLGREAAMEYIERNIGAIIHYDREKATDYLPTLKELLCNTSIREKAAILKLHPKTIIFRQRRIEQMLKVDLGNDDTRLALKIAVKLKQLYQA